MKKLTSIAYIFSISLILVSSVFISSCTPKSSEPMVLKIGAIVSLTGPAAVGCIPLMEGTQLAADWINENGGITVNKQQYMIEIVGEDDKSAPPDAVKAANKVVHQDGVKFLIAPILVPNNLAIAPICEEAKVIRMKAIIPGGAFEVNPDMRYSFAAGSQDYNTPPIYDYILENYPNIKKVAFMVNDDQGGQASMEIGIAEAKSRGLEVVYSQRYPLGTEDYYPMLSKALDAKMDALDICNGLPMWQASVIKQAREMGFEGPIFGRGATGDLPAVAFLVGPEYGHDIVITDFNPADPGMPPMIQDIGKRVAENLDSAFSIGHVDSWTSLWTLVQGIEAAQSFDTDVVVDTMQKMEVIETPFGTGRMGGEDLVGINNVLLKPRPFSKITDGQIELIGFINP